jgi:hypothetical protein
VIHSKIGLLGQFVEKSSCLAAALGVKKFVAIIMTSVTVSCETQVHMCVKQTSPHGYFVSTRAQFSACYRHGQMWSHFVVLPLSNIGVKTNKSLTLLAKN